LISILLFFLDFHLEKIVIKRWNRNDIIKPMDEKIDLLNK
jgi:hypothetical protein